MKLVLALLFTTALGFGGYRASTAPEEAPTAACSIADACDVTIECTDDGTCLIRCMSDDGRACELELACDGDECVVVRCSRDGEPCDGPEPCSPCR